MRNHGFLLTERGWRLTPAYDLNPNETGSGLKQNISENDNSLSVDLVLSVARYFMLNETKSKAILNEMQGMISTWNVVAKNMGISNKERQRMSGAFNR